jgi:hypothetical protein
MVLVKLQGGLGNQLFQYAAARSLINESDKVYLDHRFLEQNNTDNEHFTARRYELHIFKNLKAANASKWQINRFTSQSVYFRLLRRLFGYKVKYIQQQENEYVELPAVSANPKIYLDGYFQSEKYFQHLLPGLIREFEFPRLDDYNESLKQEIINTPNSVSIHIRRGDYLKSSKVSAIHGTLPYAYYQKAIDILSAKFSGLKLFIFSEDIEWAKEKFKGGNIHFFDHNRSADSWKDMALMAQCKHHIIANSSFSWWGAWLAKNKGDVFAPANWFNPLKVNFKIEDFIPASWTILDIE